MNSVRSELAEYSKDPLFGLSDFYQQFCGQVTQNWNLLLSKKAGTAMAVPDE